MCTYVERGQTQKCMSTGVACAAFVPALSLTSQGTVQIHAQLRGRSQKTFSCINCTRLVPRVARR